MDSCVQISQELRKVILVEQNRVYIIFSNLYPPPPILMYDLCCYAINKCKCKAVNGKQLAVERN